MNTLPSSEIVDVTGPKGDTVILRPSSIQEISHLASDFRAHLNAMASHKSKPSIPLPDFSAMP